VDRGHRFVHCVLVRISPVAARLQYMSGRDEVMRQWSMLKIPYIDPTPQHVGVCDGVWMR
jgi:hypothetical protein